MLSPCLLARSHIKPLHVQRSGCKNRALNYRVILNEKHDYEASKPTSRLSVPRQSQQQPQRRRAVAVTPLASSVFKSRVLNPVHLNQIMLNDNDNDSKEEDVAANAKNSGEKQRMKKNQQNQHKCGSQPLRSPKTIHGPDSIPSSDDDSPGFSSDVQNINKNPHHQVSFRFLGITLIL